MNHVYRLIWSRARNAWMVCSETARARRKGSGRSRTLLAATLSLAAALANAAPHGGHVVSGSGTISTAGNTTTITQSSATLSLTWQGFDVAPQQTVDFVQPGTSSIAINNILGTSGSEILGHLNANGQIYLINPNGIVFGKGAQVNVGGLVASSLGLDATSLSGNGRSFNGTRAGSVINQGSITSASGGYVVLLGTNVINQGTIVSRLGTVALGAGNSVTLTFDSDSLIGVQVAKSTLTTLAANGGVIQADGGKAILTAGGKDAVLASVVNNAGVIEARTVADHNGTITLLGGATAGTVNVGGTLDASAPNGGNGGSIETSAAHVKVGSGAKVTSAAAHGLVGTWVIDPQDFTVAASGGDETGAELSTALDSTNVQLESSAGTTGGSGNVNVDDAVTWSANTTLTLTASNDVNVDASVTATGTGAGLVINPNTANGAETASGTGTFNLAQGASINLPNVPASSTAALVIGGQPYTVVNSLGAAGSMTGTDLQGIDGNLAGFFALGSDIDASATSSWNGGDGFTPIGSSSTPFTGTFEGLGHTIGGLTIHLPGNNDVGFFGFSSGAIRDIGLAGAAVTGGSYSVGGLAGYNTGTMSNSYVTGTVTASLNSTGGLVGSNYGTVSGSHMDGVVDGVDNAGGLAGLNSGTITDSYATARVAGDFDVGGLVGDAQSGGSISNSYATGSAQGINNIGGLVGFNGNTIENSYSTGSATASGSNVGGLIGANYGTVGNSFWNETTSGTTSSQGGTGLTTAQMQTAASFAGFTFTGTPGATGNSWVIVDTDGSLNNAGGATGATLPMLASEYATTITNAHQLQLMAMAPTASYSLGADIDATATGGTGDVWSGAGFVPVGSSGTPFTGTFDGLGHTIRNLTISQTSSSSSDTGLFGYVGSTGVVTNVGLVGASVTGYGTAGALVGYNAGAISDSSSTGSVSASSTVGGLVGTNGATGTISNSQSAAIVTSLYSTAGGLVGSNYGALSASHATGDVTSSGYGTGGLVGAMESGSSITNSYATGDVIANGTYGRRAGGLVGTGYGGTVAGSYATGTVTGNHAIGGLIGASWAAVTNSYATGTVSASNGQGGGLIGVSLASVSDSYATGNVSGTGTQFGGLAGGNGGAITDSYATGTVDATSYVGGLVGGNYGTVTNAYSSGTVTGVSDFGGLVGGTLYGRGSTADSFWDMTASAQSTSAGGTGLTTTQMQQQSNFAGWDFTHTWVVYGGETDPLLQAFMTPITVTAGDAAITYDGTAYSGGNGVSYSASPNGNLLGTLTYGGSAQGAVDAGTYAITPGGLYSNQQGYFITAISGTLTVNPGTLTYSASPASLAAGQSPNGLTGTVAGFVGSDTLANATSGALTWTTAATASSPAGSYAIDGTGLTASNYVFVQAPDNATALTLTAAAGNSGNSSNAGGSSGGTGSGATGSSGGTAGNSAGGSGSPGNSSSGLSSPLQSALDRIAALDADARPLLTGNTSQPAGASPVPLDGTLQLSGNGTLRVERYGVRLPAYSIPVNP